MRGAVNRWNATGLLVVALLTGCATTPPAQPTSRSGLVRDVLEQVRGGDPGVDLSALLLVAPSDIPAGEPELSRFFGFDGTAAMEFPAGSGFPCRLDAGFRDASDDPGDEAMLRACQPFSRIYNQARVDCTFVGVEDASAVVEFAQALAAEHRADPRMTALLVEDVLARFHVYDGEMASCAATLCSSSRSVEVRLLSRCEGATANKDRTTVIKFDGLAQNDTVAYASVRLVYAELSGHHLLYQFVRSGTGEWKVRAAWHWGMS